MVQFELPDAKRSLIESLSLISLRVDCRQKIERGRGVKGGTGDPPDAENPASQTLGGFAIVSA